MPVTSAGLEKVIPISTSLAVEEMLDLVLLKGDIGFGESYIKQFFTTSNIADLLLFISLNQHELQPLFHSNFFLQFELFRFGHL